MFNVTIVTNVTMLQMLLLMRDNKKFLEQSMKEYIYNCYALGKNNNKEKYTYEYFRAYKMSS